MTYKIINRNLKKVIDEIEKHNKIVRRQLSRKFEDMYDPKLWIISSYYNLISLVKNISRVLDEKDNVSGIMILTRSCLEIYINIENILKDDGVLLRDESEKIFQKKNSLRKKLANLENFSRADKIEIIHYLANLIDSSECLKYTEKKYLSWENKKKNIRLPKGLCDFYAALSEHVHGGHTALMQLHVRKVSNKKYQASSSKKLPKEIVQVTLAILLSILFASIVKVFSDCLGGFEQGLNHNLKGISSAIQACRDKILKE